MIPDMIKPINMSFIQTSKAIFRIGQQHDQANGYGSEGELKFQVGDTALYIPGPGKDAEWTPERN